MKLTNLLLLLILCALVNISLKLPSPITMNDLIANKGERAREMVKGMPLVNVLGPVDVDVHNTVDVNVEGGRLDN